MKQSRTENLLLKLVSVVIALLLWIVVNGETNTTFHVQADVAYLFSDTLTSTRPLSNEVRLTLKGPLLLSRNIKRLNTTFNLKHLRKGQATFSIPKGSFALPRSVEVIAVDPPFINLALEAKIRKQLPVSLVTNGESAKGYEIDLANSKLSPEQVWVSGPKSALQTLEQIFTQPIDIKDRKEAFSSGVQLDFQGRNLVWDSEEGIKAQLAFRERLIQRTLSLPIEIMNTQYKTRLTPDHLNITVEGPMNYLSQMDAGLIHVRYDAKGRRMGKRYIRLTPVLPDTLQLIQINPQRVLLHLYR